MQSASAYAEDGTELTADGVNTEYTDPTDQLVHRKCAGTPFNIGDDKNWFSATF